MDPIAIVAVLLVLVLGWLISRDLAKVAPALFRRMDPSTAGTVEFLIRFVAVAATVLGRVRGRRASRSRRWRSAVPSPRSSSVSPPSRRSATSSREWCCSARARSGWGSACGCRREPSPARRGCRLVARPALHDALTRRERIMIPNNVVLSSAVMPLREPNPVDVKVTLNRASAQATCSRFSTPISRSNAKAPSVLLEEVDGDSVVVRVRRTGASIPTAHGWPTRSSPRW